MTLNELKNEVLSLMFESELDSSEAFVFAANRALSEIHGDVERIETKRIYKKRVVPKEYYEKLSHEAGKSLTLNIKGRAFSLNAVGKGEISFKDGASHEIIRFSGTSTEISRKINTGLAILNFLGENDYDIYSLASFDTLLNESLDGVPLYSPFIRYDLRNIDPLFLFLQSSVKDGNGDVIPGIKVEGSYLFVPKDYEGDLILTYRRAGKKIAADELDGIIDISPECEHLIPLRCAAYLLFDGNEGLSEYYLSLYKNAVSALKASRGRVTSEKFLDVLGWA